MENNNFVAPDKRTAMAHIINLMNLACTDGKISEQELQVIGNIAQAYGLTKEEYDRCADTCNECLKKGTVVMEIPKNDEDKATFIKNLVFTMMADGVISDSERDYVEFMADRFGFRAKDFVDFLIKKINEEYGHDDQTDTQQAIEQAIEQGKEALLKNDIELAFNLLYNAAHLDKTACRLFLMIPEIEKRMFLLTVDQGEFLEEEAKKGDTLAQYTLGRYYQAHGNSFDEARDLFISSAKVGLGDSIAALARLMINGHLADTEVDKDMYYQGMTEAYEKGSILGQYYIYRAAMVGFNGNPADPQAVIDNIKQWLDGNESEDLLKINPTYYEILAQAYERQGDSKSAANYFMKAVRMGRVDLYHDWVLNTFFNDNMELVDEEGYLKAIEDGITLGCGYSYLLRADLNQQLYDASEDENEKAQLSEMIQQDLSTAANMGEGYGFYIYGHHSYYGSYGFTQDNNVAWMNFLDASGMNIPEAWEMMIEMHLEGDTPDGLGHNFVSHCRLMGLRQGNDDMLIPVIVSFYGGYLEKYRNEVEKYYLPAYNDLPDEVKTEYFGIEFLATINTEGKANLIQFDFETEEWSEVEEIIDAERLEAIHCEQLDEIGKKLGLEGRITAWVDSDRAAKNLEPNVLGKLFFGTPILGDVIITLEDDEFNPETIDLVTMKQIMEAMGAELDHVYYDEFPDNDSQWDPNV